VTGRIIETWCHDPGCVLCRWWWPDWEREEEESEDGDEASGCDEVVDGECDQDDDENQEQNVLSEEDDWEMVRREEAVQAQERSEEDIERNEQEIYNEEIEQQADWNRSGEAELALPTPANVHPRVVVPPIDSGDEDKENRLPLPARIPDDLEY
jgi:hypothetical protein